MVLDEDEDDEEGDFFLKSFRVVEGLLGLLGSGLVVVLLRWRSQKMRTVQAQRKARQPTMAPIMAAVLLGVMVVLLLLLSSLLLLLLLSWLFVVLLVLLLMMLVGTLESVLLDSGAGVFLGPVAVCEGRGVGGGGLDVDVGSTGSGSSSSSPKGEEGWLGTASFPAVA